jgi:hypothetical protein
MNIADENVPAADAMVLAVLNGRIKGAGALKACAHSRK